MLKNFLIACMTVEYLKINASNKKQLQRLLSRREEKIGVLFMILLTVAVLGLVGLLYLF